MSNLVIVAIPDENDRVWKISSEKVPHLTLLFLGDVDNVSNVDQIVQFVEHAASQTLRRFYLPVDRRDELGEDQADVLFFKKGRYDYKAIRDFRAILLKDHNIRTAYDNATQFDGVWQPHLTLGYPASPAKPDETDRDYGFYDVGFNKIAVWLGDYEGPEFLLKDYWDELDALESVPMDVAMSDIQHYGVKGMKWGVRRANVQLKKAARQREEGDRINRKADKAVGATRKRVLRETADKKYQEADRLERQAQKKFDRAESGTPGKIRSAVQSIKRGLANLGAELAESNWQKSVYSDTKHEAVHNHVAKDLDNKIFRLQTSPKYKGKNLRTDSDLRKKYYEDVAKVTDSSYRRAIKDLYGENYKGTQKAHYVHDARGPRIEVRDKHTNEVAAESPLRSRAEIRRRREEREREAASATHAAMTTYPDLSIDLKIDDNGQIVGVGFIKTAEAEEAELAQTVELGEEFLAHFGVKGMKWGVRNKDTTVTVNGSTKQVTAKKAAKLDKKWEKQIYTVPGAVKVHNAMAEYFNARIGTINDKPEYKNLNLHDRPHEPAAQKYMQEVNALTMMGNRLAVEKVHGKSPTGTKKAELSEDGTKIRIVDAKKVKHAAEDEDTIIEISLRRDENGKILEMNTAELKDSVTQTIDLGSVHLSSIVTDETLAHYGVKGMKWGVRKEPPTAVATSSTSRVPHGKKRKTKIEVSGGENHPAHSDALKVAEARIKMQRSGTAALSNQELREVANRMQLEQQVKQLTTSGGKRFVSGLLKSEGQQASRGLLRKGAKGTRKVALGF